jgi:hypothetical protein
MRQRKDLSAAHGCGPVPGRNAGHLDDFPAYFDLQHRLCQQLVEPGVLSFELSEALGI